MTQDLFVSTRKGLFRVVKGAGGWRIADVQFLGDPDADPGDGCKVKRKLYGGGTGGAERAIDNGEQQSVWTTRS